MTPPPFSRRLSPPSGFEAGIQLNYSRHSPTSSPQPLLSLCTYPSILRILFLLSFPPPTLTGMVAQMLKAEYKAGDDSVSPTRAILCHVNYTNEVYY